MAELKTLGKLFPNLRVIRGKKLFWNYALILWGAPHLQEIGLTSLQHIGRGAIKIGGCPNLCYASTIDWEALGASTLDFPENRFSRVCSNKDCPNECRENCWNSMYCQKFPDVDNCHPQCLGCSKANSSRHCNICRYFDNDGECVSQCPKSKLSNYYSMKCMKRQECTKILNGTWWIFNDTCIHTCPKFYERNENDKNGCTYVGDNYQKTCNGTVIDSLTILEEMAACTHINGSLEIRIPESYIEHFEQSIEMNLGNIVSISGYLKIGRSNPIRSLYFFKKLRVIKGEALENQKYALFIFDNQNLQRLWNFSDDFDLTIKRGSIAFHDNPQLCFSDIEKLVNLTRLNNNTDLEISKYSNGQRSSCNVKDIDINIVKRNPRNVTLSWPKQEAQNNDTVIGYTVYYIKADKGNVSAFENKDVCDMKSWASVLVFNNTVELKYLLPYTRYGCYIKIYTASSQVVQTPVYYFLTASDDPSAPVDFKADVSDDTTIVLSWLKPRNVNGKLSHYIITMYLQEDSIPLVEQRNYCLHPHTQSDEESEYWHNENPDKDLADCNCEFEDRYQFFRKDQFCEDIGEDCKKFMYVTNADMFDNMTVETINSIKKRYTIDEAAKSFNTSKKFRYIIKTDVNNTSYKVTNLKHFSLYVFFLMACNENEDDRDQCSSVEMESQRTKKKDSADTIRSFNVKVNDRNAYVTWTEPEEVNAVIVSYTIEHRNIEVQHPKAISECITRLQFEKNKGRYAILGLVPGKYELRVRATSLAGPANFTKWKYFEIAHPSSSGYWISILVTLVCLMFIALGAYAAWFFYKRKYALDHNHLITSINPDYAGPIYVEDEWEIDRNDVIILDRLLGHGSFGKVHEGLIKSRGYHCAIKTVNENATGAQRVEFLTEGSVMKQFNDAHHVVKLLGIVSRGQPPLVIMELMERGDLKNFLRRCRGPSQNLTSNEIYRMAAEIADGMAYLAAKKYVHRDLAARNCMVASDRTVKIGDFGMARDIYETDYYRKETVGLLPVRWMAPESLADGVFTSDSDVWSYGIVLWEMATLAEQPYQGMSNEEVFHFVKNRGKLDRPPECSDLLYEVMEACWLWRPNDRPTFLDIVDRLVDHVGQAFRLVAFCYSNQGQEIALHAGPRAYNPPAMTVEDDFFGHYDASEEEVSLYKKEKSRPTKFLPLSNQRYNNTLPYQISPGSPTSTFSLNSS